MLTPTSKVFLPVAGVALFLGAVYKILTGDLLGGVLYLMVGAVAAVLGVMLSTVRENEVAPAIAADAGPPSVRPVAVAPLPSGGAWPLVAAVAVGLVALGLIESSIWAWAGVLVAMVAGAGWIGRASSESTGRPVSLLPIGLPVLGLAFIASVMFFLSRILLAVPEAASTAIALGVAVVIMIVASLAAVRPRLSGGSMAALLALGAVVMVGGGIVAAAQGEREIEKHSEEHAGEAGLVQIRAENTAFAQEEITLTADAEVELRLDNNDRGIQHNIAIFGADPSRPLFRGELVNGVGTVTYRFHAPPAGEYRFQCDVHPAQMKGTVKVV